ncbi:MAG: NosD domain-containing protein [Pirellulales bacterium]
MRRSSRCYRRPYRFEALEDRRLLSVFSVFNTNDSGDGSLREAIVSANSSAGADTIQFRIPRSDPNYVDVDAFLIGGDVAADAFVIRPLSPLPPLNDVSGGTTINGRSQTSFTGDSNPFGPEIVLDGSLIPPPEPGSELDSAPSRPGLQIHSNDNQVVGLNIQRFPDSAVIISGGSDNHIRGNYIGTDATGSVVRANGAGVIRSGGDSSAGAGIVVSKMNQVVDGVRIERPASRNVIGGAAVADRNLVAGNEGGGIIISESDDNRILGNFVGIDRLGRNALGNGHSGIGPENPLPRDGLPYAGVGVFIDVGQRNVVGGPDEARNVISGNVFKGILNRFADRTHIEGNFVGTDASGRHPVPNGHHFDGATFLIDLLPAGVHVSGNDTVVVGNLISANAGIGLLLIDAADSRVVGNLIGTDVSGEVALGNALEGIAIWENRSHIETSRNVIGGTAPGDGNVISANRSGILVVSRRAVGNVIALNRIGTSASGAVPLGNRLNGIALLSNSTSVRENIIAFNEHAGITIGDKSGNRIRGNSIFSNGALGIDLLERADVTGVTPNDLGDGDTGSNNLQNFPRLFLATTLAGTTTIAGRLNSTPDSSFTVEFFANAELDPSGHGEGQRLIGSTAVRSDDLGDAPFRVSFAADVPVGHFITATATDVHGNTSEFSLGHSVSVIPMALFDAGTLTIFGTDRPDALALAVEKSGAIVLTDEVTKTNVPIIDAQTGEPIGPQGSGPTVFNTKLIEAFLGRGNDDFGVNVPRPPVLGGIKFNVFGQGGSDVYSMVNLDAPSETFSESWEGVFDGGEGFDFVEVIGSAFADQFDISGGANRGTTQINITDIPSKKLRAQILTIDVESLSTQAGAGMDELNVTSSPYAALVLDGGEDADTVAIQFGRVEGRVRVSDSGQRGTDTLKLLGTDFAEKFNVFPEPQTGEWIAKWEGPSLDSQSAGISIESIEIAHEELVMQVEAGDGDDDVHVVGGRSLVKVFGQGGNDHGHFTAVDGLSVEQEVIEFDGGDGVDALEVIGRPGSEIYDISPGPQPNGGRIKGYAQVTGTASVCVDFEDVETTKVATGDGDDDVRVTHPLPTHFTLLTEDGNDVFRFKYTMFMPDGITVRPVENFAFKAAVDLGDGKDRVTMQGTDEDESFEVMGVPDATVPDPHIRITDLTTKLVPFDGLIVGAEAIDIHTVGGKDQYTMSDAQGSLGGIDFKVDTGDDDDRVNVEINTKDLQPPSDNPGATGSGLVSALSQDPLLAFRFSLATGAGDDMAFFKSLGGLQYETEVVDFQGGAGDDRIDIQVKSPRDPASLSYDIAPGTGDDEVLVAFEHGDIQHPYVLGALWNDHASPNQGGDQTGGQLSLDIRMDGKQPGVGLGLIGTAGRDTVDIDIRGASEELALDVRTGDGDDEVVVGITNPPPAGGGEDQEPPGGVRRRSAMAINTGDGKDRLHFEETGLNLAESGQANWSFLGGEGDDEFDLRLADARGGAQATWNWITDTGDGNDALKVHLFEIGLGAGSLTNWSFLTGEGRDNIDFVRCFMDVGPKATYAWSLGTGDGDDTVAVMILDVTFGEGVKATYAWDTGAGKDVVTADVSGLTLSQGAQLDWSIDSGDGNDVVKAIVRGRFDGDLRVNLGEGNDSFTLDAPDGWQTAAIPRDPDIVVEAGGGNDSVTFRFGGPLTANLEIIANLGDGNDSFLLDAQQGWQAAAIPEAPCLLVEAGSGNDSVTFRFGGVVSASLEILADLGVGNDEFLLDAQGGFSATPDPKNPQAGPSVQVTGGAHNDKITLHLGEVSGNFRVVVDGMEGNDHLAADLLFAEQGLGLIDVALFGGEDNDLLSLLAFGQTDPQRPPRLLIDGGPDRDTATATANVEVVNCEVVRRRPQAQVRGAADRGGH